MSRSGAERRGRRGEWVAILYLAMKGYRILGRRLRTPFGEVDIAAWKRGVLVIVEVKARASFAAGMYAVTPRAQQRIARAAQSLVGRWRLRDPPVRFDVIVVGAGWLPKHERAAWRDEPRSY
jgi:putative endonuclease